MDRSQADASLHRAIADYLRVEDSHTDPHNDEYSGFSRHSDTVVQAVPCANGQRRSYKIRCVSNLRPQRRGPGAPTRRTATLDRLDRAAFPGACLEQQVGATAGLAATRHRLVLGRV